MLWRLASRLTQRAYSAKQALRTLKAPEPFQKQGAAVIGWVAHPLPHPVRRWLRAAYVPLGRFGVLDGVAGDIPFSGYLPKINVGCK